jgi:SAM-dependent methyltransferase
MAVSQEVREQVLRQAQGALALQIAFIGVTNGLFGALERGGPLAPASLAAAAGVDPGYTERWADAAFAFGYLDREGAAWALTELGRAFVPGAEGTLMPFAVNVAIAAHMAERAAGLMATGERPGEAVLGERATLLPWFGPMLEATFGPLFEREVLPGVPVYREVDARGGVVVDLGCGNGWYLRRLAARHPHLRGVGLDGFRENVDHARRAAEAEGLADRLEFREGDIHDFRLDAPADLVAMNRALHHVWDRRDEVFAALRDHLKPGGAAVVWEPRWPDDVAALREPRRRAMAFQNLSEHVQGNRFLRPGEVEAAFRAAGMEAETFLFAGGDEMVVVGRRP